MRNKYMKMFFSLTVLSVSLIFCSGCGSEREKKQEDVSVQKEADNKDAETNQDDQMEAEEVRKVQIKKKFDGIQRVKTSEGRMWTPPAGSYENTDGYIYDQEGAVIGFTGPVKYNPNAKG